jgi:hypothetical protein
MKNVEIIVISLEMILAHVNADVRGYFEEFWI